MQGKALPLSALTLLLLSLPWPAEAGPPEAPVRLALFSTRAPGDMFWGPFEDFMRAACDDLGMELTVYYAEGDHFKLLEQARSVLADPQKADFLVVANFKRQAIKVLELAEKAKRPVFIVNSGLFPEDNAGAPRQKFHSWIGELLPDDEAAGALLARILLSRASVAEDGLYHMLAIEGNPSDSASIERLKGLKRSLEGRSDVLLEQIVPAHWEPEQAREKFTILKKRYPLANVCWTASDGMALGVAQAAQELGLKPNLDIFTGGVDWAREGLEGVKSGQMAATIGGHFMEGTWVAVLIYDYLHGRDFASESLRLRSTQTAITQENVDFFLEKLAPEPWAGIDFRRFSKALQPSLKKYRFTLEALWEQLR